ncbi:lamin Dm0-like [Musca autumnalis]|uniref:lamin Dm0-like n=1 Tax=Musca autumnalis TaxID=221902 RepID=UPI003CEF0B90
MKVKDYEEVNGKWVPKLNTRQVDNNSIRKIENENVRGDVSRKFKSEINRIREENERLKARFDQKATACSIAEENARLYESRVEDLRAKYNAANAEKEKTVEDLDELRKEFEYQQKNIQSLRNELTFKDQIHAEEINELRTRLSAQYEATLQELRAQFEGQMSSSRAEINIMKSRIVALESTNAAVNARNYDLEKLLDNERARHVTDSANMEAELQCCRDEMAQQLQESSAYDNLLCGEEDSSQTEWVVTSREDDIEISNGDPKARVQQKSTNEVQIDGGATVSQRFVTDTAQKPPTKIMMKPRKWKSVENIRTTIYNANEEEVAGADRVKRTIIRHVSGHRIINEGSFSGEKYPLRRNWIYHVFYRGKRSPHPYWLLKVLGAIT